MEDNFNEIQKYILINEIVKIEKMNGMSISELNDLINNKLRKMSLMKLYELADEYNYML